MTRVVWLGSRTMAMDQHLLDTLLTGPAWQHEEGEWSQPLQGEGAVVIVPARFYSAAQVNHAVSQIPWCVVVLTSDEESLFDHRALSHPAMRVWVMTPRPGQHEPGPRYLGEGCHRDTGAHLVSSIDGHRPVDVQFAGQVTHERREAMLEAAQNLGALVGDLEVELTATDGFMAGDPLPVYLDRMVHARVVLCPSGPQTPDSFRLYEALEAGCVPIVEAACAAVPEPGYWQLVYPDGVPFPIVEHWSDLEAVVYAVLEDWPALAARCQAWWLGVKRRIVAGLVDDVLAVAGHLRDPRHQAVTVLVPTSPTSEGAGPALDRLAHVLDSVRERLPDAEVVVMADGVRAEQQHLADEYASYVRELVWSCAHRWHDVVPFVAHEHLHQANLTREGLRLVRTDLVLFVEHDMPLVGEIPFDAVGEVLRSSWAYLVRFPQDREREQYPQFLLDAEPVDVAGVPLLRTLQWSQRPHMATTSYYRWIVSEFFGSRARTMIEDVMHGVAANAAELHGPEAGWARFRLALYAPPDGAPRSMHLDGRGETEPKFDMVYAYDGPTPEGAPAPTEAR